MVTTMKNVSFAKASFNDNTLSTNARRALGAGKRTTYANPVPPNAAGPRTIPFSGTYTGEELKQEPARGAGSLAAYKIKSEGTGND